MHSDVLNIKAEPDAAGEFVSNPDLAALFKEHYPRIYNYLRYRVSVVEDAEDLIGTVFEQAFKKKAQFNPDRGTFAAWLFGIARNELVSHHRRQKSRAVWETSDEPPADLTTTEPSPEAQVIHQEALLRVVNGIDQLAERDQEIISLKFAGQLSNQEIGQIMALKEKTVSVVLLRAVRRLRKQIEKEATA